MNATSLEQVRSIAGTDLRLRLRRPATLWLIVALSGLAYSLVPDPSTGRALMVVDGARALYTSQVVALVTASLAAVLLSFAGFYLTSNALSRDLAARTGAIIAATPVSSGAYLAGKWLGGSAYLSLVSGAYLLNILAMHLLRGEGPLEPAAYLLTYLLALGPAILVISALALCFECVPLLAGRVGDVAYFFVWMVLLAMGAVGASAGRAAVLDVMGLGFIIGQVQQATSTTNLAIGMTPFDAGVTPWVLPPLRLTASTVLPRLATASLAIPVLLLARLFFHRFDPARVSAASRAAGSSLVRQLSMYLKPMTRLVSDAGARLMPTVPAGLRPAIAETVMSLSQAPLLLLAWLGVSVTALVGSDATVQHTLPVVVAVILAIGLADLSTRDRRAGTLSLLYSMPGVQPGYARIKLGAACLLGLLFCLPAALRISIGAPGEALSLVIGAGFMAASATALGLLTRTPKTFMGVFLLFLYLVLNGAQAPGLDFAGWNGVATGATRLGYLIAAVVLAGLAEAKQRWDLAREG